MRDAGRMLLERRSEGSALWTSEQKINAAIIFSCEQITVRTSGDRDRTETNHGVLCVGKDGPAVPVDLLNDERIRDEPRFLFRNVTAVPDVADIGEGNNIHRRCVLRDVLLVGRK